MSEVIFVRHGESEMNEKGVYCGWSDSPLTPKGIIQAQAVSKKLADERIDLIISSNLDRCLVTAEIINRFHDKRIIQESELKEINFGKWEGLSYKDICREFYEEEKMWREDYIGFKIPEGESLLLMHKRVNNVFNKIIEDYHEKKILIVAHSGVIRSILSQRICGSIEGYWKFKIENCGIARIQFMDDFPVLIGINQ